jgi:hypothetical protein
VKPDVPQARVQIRIEGDAMKKATPHAGVGSTVFEIESSRNRGVEVPLLFAEEAVVPERPRRIAPGNPKNGLRPVRRTPPRKSGKCRADVFLTTDDELLRCVRKNPGCGNHRTFGIIFEGCGFGAHSFLALSPFRRNQHCR